VSSDVRSIVDKLLQPELSQRYKAASQLVEDLQRHLQDFPLKHATNRSLQQRCMKWARRHPRVSSATTVISLSAAAMLLMATWLVYYRVQFRTQQAQQIVSQFQAELPSTLVLATHHQEYDELETPLQDAARSLLSTLKEADSDSPHAAIDYLRPSDRVLLAANLRQLDKTLRFTREEQSQKSPQLVSLAQNAHALADRLNRDEKLDALIQSAVSDDFRDMTLATQAYCRGDVSQAVELLRDLLERSPDYHAAWLLLGTCHHRLGDTVQADAAYATSQSLMPNHWQSWYHRAVILHGSARRTQRPDQLESAERLYSRALQLRPGLTAAIFNRALCRESLGRLDEALEDAQRLISQSKELVRAHFLAARVLRKQGKNDLAQDQTAAALESTPLSSHDYVYLGSAQLATNRQAAIDNYRKAWELAPNDPETLQSLAYLSMELKTDDSAAKWLDLWIAALPRQAAPLASRAVFYARQGKNLEAQRDCDAALKLHPTPREQAQIASAHVLIADTTAESDAKQQHIAEAMSLLVKAIQSEWRLVAEVASDPDMKTLQSDRRFQSMVKTAYAFGQLPKLLESPHENLDENQTPTQNRTLATPRFDEGRIIDMERRR
jgi:Flp pilus assembly protein TadD